MEESRKTADTTISNRYTDTYSLLIHILFHFHFIGEKRRTQRLTQRSVPKVTQVVTSGDET